MSFLKKGLLQNYIMQDGFESEQGNNYKRTSKNFHVCTWDGKYKKDDVFSLHISRNGATVAVFYFSLPPQSVDTSYPQRVFETKTFGGSIVEDYGNDTSRITIQGTTANSDIRHFISGKSENGNKNKGTGIDELNALRTLLYEYGRIENISGKSVTLRYKEGNFRVFVLEFDIKNSKDNPLSHFYTLTFLGVPLDTSYNDLRLDDRKTFKERLNDIYSTFDGFIETQEKRLKVLENGLQAFEDYLDICTAVRSAITRSERAVNNLVNHLLAYPDTLTTSINETVEIENLVVSSAIRISLGTVDKALNSMNDLVKAMDRQVKFFEDFPTTYGKMSNDIMERWKMTSREIVDTCKFMALDSAAKARALQCDVKHATSTCDGIVVPGGGNTDDTVLFSYGSKEYVVAKNDTWDSIALRQYGDPSKAVMLSSFNSSRPGESSELPPAGEKIYIPVLESDTGFDGTNEVYNEPGVIDNYGHDILIDPDGDFAVHNGDFAVTDGRQTLTQAVINRLSTAVGSRIRNALYGIRTNIGSAGDAAGLVIADSVRATLLQDPRIKSIDSIRYAGRGDVLEMVITYTDINDTKETIGGVF